MATPPHGRPKRMTDPSQLSDRELFWLSSLVLSIVSCGVWAARSRDPRTWMQPPLVMGVIFLYYCVAGPLNILSRREWFDRGVDLRSGMGMAWTGATVAFLAFLAGYGLLRQRLSAPGFSSMFQASQAERIGRRLNFFALIVFGLVAGGRLITYLNPFGVADATISVAGLDLGAFTNYATLSINLLIPGCLLIGAAWIKRRDSPLPLVLWLLATTAIFTSLGFRWRLAVLIASLLMLWYLARRIRPKMLVLIPSIFGLLLLAGVVGITRSYGEGLDLSALKGLSLLEILLAGFGAESSVFLTSGAMMELTPKLIPYAGATPIINTLLFPIPSALFPTKDSARYLFDATAVVYNSDIHNSGSAILNFAEYFLIAGWPSLIIGYFLLGWLCRRLWLWFQLRSDEPLAQVTYVVNAAYLYMVVSRGYMPQVAMLWFFTCAPLFLLYYNNAQNQLRMLKTLLPRTTERLLPPHLRSPRRSRIWGRFEQQR